MKLNPWSGIKWLFGAMLVMMLVGPFLRVADRMWSENKDRPVVKSTGGFVGDWTRTAFSIDGNGGFIGPSADDPEGVVKSYNRAVEAKKAAIRNLKSGEIDAKAKAEKFRIAQRELGVIQEWRPRITWKDVDTSTSGPVAVTVGVFRQDLPGGLTAIEPWFMAKRGDPPTNMEDILTDGGQYLFQAYVDEAVASAPIGPLTFIRGRGWQGSSGAIVLTEPIVLEIDL